MSRAVNGFLSPFVPWALASGEKSSDVSRTGSANRREPGKRLRKDRLRSTTDEFTEPPKICGNPALYPPTPGAVKVRRGTSGRTWVNEPRGGKGPTLAGPPRPLAQGGARRARADEPGAR